MRAGNLLVVLGDGAEAIPAKVVAAHRRHGTVRGELADGAAEHLLHLVGEGKLVGVHAVRHLREENKVTIGEIKLIIIASHLLPQLLVDGVEDNEIREGFGDLELFNRVRGCGGGGGLRRRGGGAFATVGQFGHQLGLFRRGHRLLEVSHVAVVALLLLLLAFTGLSLLALALAFSLALLGLFGGSDRCGFLSLKRGDSCFIIRNIKSLSSFLTFAF